MSTEDVTQTVNTVDNDLTTSTWINESETATIMEENFLNEENSFNESAVQQPLSNDTIQEKELAPMFEAFIIIEIIMTTLELIISTAAAAKMKRWRRNYRNQMLMQLSVARFIKRVGFLLTYLQSTHVLEKSANLTAGLNGLQVYIDFVIIILVFFFIKHMYDSLIIVLIKINKNILLKTLACAWLLPVPICVACTLILIYELVDEWLLFLIICCVFRWPMMFLGTTLYITIVYRVWSDKIRQFARSLTVVTFLMCLVINFYLFSKDIIELWCIESITTKFISDSSGIIMNFLILTFYVILITLDVRRTTQSTRSLPEYSLACVK